MKLARVGELAVKICMHVLYIHTEVPIRVGIRLILISGSPQSSSFYALASTRNSIIVQSNLRDATLGIALS